MTPTRSMCVWAAFLALPLAAGAFPDADRPAPRYPRDNYSRVEPGLYLGGMLSECPPGVKTVLNVGEVDDVFTAERHYWREIPDAGPAPDLRWLRDQVRFIDRERRAGRDVYVHCRAGINRSATVVAAYLMWRDNLTRDDALDALRKKRPIVSPFGVYRDYLFDYEQALKAERRK